MAALRTTDGSEEEQILLAALTLGDNRRPDLRPAANGTGRHHLRHLLRLALVAKASTNPVRSTATRADFLLMKRGNNKVHRLTIMHFSTMRATIPRLDNLPDSGSDLSLH